MKENLVVIVENEPRAGTFILSKGFEVEHRALRKLVIKYKSEFEELGVIASAMQKPTEKGGRPINEFMLNENQSMYLGTLLTNNVIVRRFKLKLVKEFDRLKKDFIELAIQHQNAQWLDQRKSGISVRKVETDAVKRLVDYAISQGSKNAQKYYMAISKMQNQALFFIEQNFKNIRDILNLEQLSTVVSADKIITKAIEDGLDRKLHYKEIYQLAKSRIETFAEIHGKTLIPNFSGQKQIELLN
jgi:phage regulator Rha-like protein